MGTGGVKLKARRKSGYELLDEAERELESDVQLAKLEQAARKVMEETVREEDRNGKAG